MKTIIWNSFEQAENEIRPFLAAQGSPFKGFDWLQQAWARQAPGSGRELVVVGVYEGGALTTVAPLWARRSLIGVREVGFVGDGLTPYPGFAGRVDTGAMETITNAIAERWSKFFFCFTDIIDENPLRPILDDTTLFTAKARVPLYPCPYRDLNAEENLSKNRKKFRSRVRSCTRRLRMLGDLRCEVLDFDRDRPAALAMFDRLMALHTLRHRGTLNAWCKPANRQFLRSYLEQAKSAGILVFVVLLDGAPISFHLGLVDRGSFIGYIPASHPAFLPYTIGHVNIAMALERFGEMGLHTFDLSNGGSFYKDVWATSTRWNYRYLLAGDPSPATQAAWKLSVLQSAAKAKGRESGWNRRIRSVIGPLAAVREASDAPQLTQANRELSRKAEQFSFSAVADLPADDLKTVIRFVYDHGKKTPVSCERLQHQVRLQAADPSAELVVSLT